MSFITTYEEKVGTKKVTKAKSEEVVFLYVKLQDGGYKYESKEKEYSLNFVVTEDQADEWEELFPKNTIKQIKTELFEKKYKIPPPFPNAKKQYVGKMGRDVSLSMDFPDLELSSGDAVPYFWSGLKHSL